MIRLAKISDVNSINEIYNQAVQEKHQTATLQPLSIEMQKIWFLNHEIDKYPIFVIEKENKVVGWCSLSAYRKGRQALASLAEISYYFHSDYQGQGLGTRLMEHALQTAPNYRFKNLVAILFGHNKASIKLLEKFGFKLWGNLPQTAEIDGALYDHCYYGLKLN
ncbi:GNAT family N-acetyltransferase [Desulfosarcina sp.]|nr:GNAT family N-acetyltransferase [Desulfosarcina sp.]